MRRLEIITGLMIIFSSAGFGEVVYLHRQRNSSVEMSCSITEDTHRLFALTLHRDWLSPAKVLYVHFGSSPAIFNHADRDRISVQRHVKEQEVNVTIRHLLGRHTGRYRCTFHYNSAGSGGFEDHISSTEYFLHVEDNIPEECRCNSYEPLLYSLSTAAVLLFICVLILSAVYCKRPSSQTKPAAVPIYEEMNGVRTANGKAQRFQQNLYLSEEEPINTSPRKENPYDPAPGSDLYSL